ncbi:hypothetical protein LSAT2_029836 [Lamellibrachia satsuma]|nr:hypothetical protein LSAT2_029836 [Lamellibrachia satsuma]
MCLANDTNADDQQNCCMGGMKRLRHLELCVLPCCHGYSEQAAYVLKLAAIVWCQKDTEGVPNPKNAYQEKYALGRRRRFSLLLI